MKLTIVMDKYDNPYACSESQVLKLADRYSLDAMLAQHIRLYHEISPGMAEA